MPKKRELVGKKDLDLIKSGLMSGHDIGSGT
jgi:hypothetical protein